MKPALPASVVSPQDLRAVILEVKGYLRWYTHTDIKQKATHRRAGQAPEVSPAAASLIKSCLSPKKPDQKSMEDLIDDLEDFAANATEIHITLAAPPGNGLKKDLAAWCRQNIEPDLLVSFQFDSTLLGGMVVRWRSRIFDWSFRRQILANRQKFPETLRHV